MTTFMRNTHRFAICFQLIAMAFFVYVGTVTGHWLPWVMVGWCIAFGSYSTRALRKGKEGVKV